MRISQMTMTHSSHQESDIRTILINTLSTGHAGKEGIFIFTFPDHMVSSTFLDTARANAPGPM